MTKIHNRAKGWGWQRW